MRLAQLIVVCVLALFLLAASSSQALTERQEDSSAQVTVYAPDWIWQGQNLNIVAIVENVGEEAKRYVVSLGLPDEFGDRFHYEGDADQSIILGPGESGRIAFTNIAAMRGVPRGSYEFTVQVDEVGDGYRESLFDFAYPLRTIRGAAVSDGIWAALAPAILAGAWCLILGFYLLRRGETDAWKTSSAVVWNEVES